jgi:hypothetical protein
MLLLKVLGVDCCSGDGVSDGSILSVSNVLEDISDSPLDVFKGRNKTTISHKNLVIIRMTNNHIAS